MIYYHDCILGEIILQTLTLLSYYVGGKRGVSFKSLRDAIDLICSRRQIVFHVDWYLFGVYKHGFAFNKRSAFDFLCAILPVSPSTNKGRFDNGTSAARARKGKYRSNIRHKTPQENQLVRPFASPSEYMIARDSPNGKPKTLKFLNYFIFQWGLILCFSWCQL